MCIQCHLADITLDTPKLKVTFEGKLGWRNSLSDMNPVDIVLGLHVDLDPLIHIAGMPVTADVIVNYIIEVS